MSSPTETVPVGGEAEAAGDPPVQAPTVLVLHPDKAEASRLVESFHAAGMQARALGNSSAAASYIYSEPPDVVIVHSSLPPKGGLTLCAELKRDNLFARVPLVMMFANTDSDPDWDHAPIDDFVGEDVSFDELRRRALLCLDRNARDLDASPLTRLPGNNSIMKQLDLRIARGETFAAAYADIDSFKAYNDAYGFARGDEALQLTARLILNVINSLNRPETYVGHIGGDDFFFIVPVDLAEFACQEVTRNFDLIIPGVYDADDRARGAIESTNRRGERERFPLMSLSIAVARNIDGSIQHIGQVGSITKELKKIAKQTEGSCFIIDRRGAATDTDSVAVEGSPGDDPATADADVGKEQTVEA